MTVSADGGIDSMNKTEDGDVTVNSGALRILKESSKTGNPLVSVTGPSSFIVIDNGAGGEDSTIREVCVSGLMAGDYRVSETMPPPAMVTAPRRQYGDRGDRHRLRNQPIDGR